MGQHDAELLGGVVLKAVLLLTLQLMELYTSLPSFRELFAAAASNTQWFVWAIASLERLVLHVCPSLQHILQ